MTAAPFTVVILAAQRAGVVNPLAARAGVSHKCLAPICGKPLIEHVLAAVTRFPGVARVRISIEPDTVVAVKPIADRHAVPGVEIDFVDASDNIAESVLAAAQGVDGPIVITTADNVLIDFGYVAPVLDAMADGAGAVAALTTREAVLATHPEGQRRFYELRGGAYSNCNLYAINGAPALAAVEIFREGGQFAKNPRRLITAFGLVSILLVRYRLVTIHGAMRRASRRFAVDMRAVILEDGASAIDVDNERTYAIAEALLAARLGQSAP